MIFAKIIGGLGNQMFQLAFAEVMRHIHQTRLFLDTSDYAQYSDRQYDMHCFMLGYAFARPLQLRRFREIAGRKQRIERYIANTIHGKGQVLKEQQNEQFRFNTTIVRRYPHDLYLDGYWQSYKYFIEHEDRIRALFRFKETIRLQNKAILDQTSQAQTVALHVRRGDYVHDQKANKVHGTCSLDYYQQAIELMKEKIPNPYFLIFSDDISWCKLSIRTGVSQYFVDHSNQNWEDMQLMSMCQHQIIANSSFSWWAAWLNINPDKIIIAPKKWLSNKNIPTEDLLPQNWIKI